MGLSSQASRLLRRPPRAVWGLVGLVAAAVALIGVALLVIPTVSRRPLELAPLSTPEGVVQHFYDAIYRGNYGTAYALLSDQTQRDMPLEGFQGYANFNRERDARRCCRGQRRDCDGHDYGDPLRAGRDLWGQRLELRVRSAAGARRRQLADHRPTGLRQGS